MKLPPLLTLLLIILIMPLILLMNGCAKDNADPCPRQRPPQDSASSDSLVNDSASATRLLLHETKTVSYEK